MTRDSLLWIENGKIASGLKRVWWNESRPLPNVDAETGSALLPTLKVADF